MKITHSKASRWEVEFCRPGFSVERIPLRGRLVLGNRKEVDLLLPDAPLGWGMELCEEGTLVSQGVLFHVFQTDPPVRTWGCRLRGGVWGESGWFSKGGVFQLGDWEFQLLSSGAEKDSQQTEKEMPFFLVFPKGVSPWKTLSELGRKLLEQVHKIAPTSLSIYLEGETGTGKEVLARLIHGWSTRSEHSFIPIHCGALPPTLVESELFGHVRGAFTGASQGRSGALVKAHGGTLFLDEVGDLPLEIQVKLLRFLENGEVRPVGSDRLLQVDVRVICATHHSLKKLVAEGKFRSDLYYRLASCTLQVPPLRARTEDLFLLATERAEGFQKKITQEAWRYLKQYSWPGNVRELKHVIERACHFSEGFYLQPQDFDFLSLEEVLLEGSEKVYLQAMEEKCEAFEKPARESSNVLKNRLQKLKTKYEFDELEKEYLMSLKSSKKTE